MRDVARFTRRGLTLVPADREGREMLPKIADGKSVFVQLRLPRNMNQHRKYFAILNNVVEATGRWTSTEHLRKDILIALHRYDEEADQFTGEIRKVPHSMAVASMPKADFEQLYSETINLLTEALGADPELLTQEAA
jgi:hypothetical protein